MSFPCSGLGATINVAKPPKGSTVAIFGLGAVGLAVSVEIIRSLYATISIAMRTCVGFASNTLLICIIRLQKVQGLLERRGSLVLI